MVWGWKSEIIDSWYSYSSADCMNLSYNPVCIHSHFLFYSLRLFLFCYPSILKDCILFILAVKIMYI